MGTEIPSLTSLRLASLEWVLIGKTLFLSLHNPLHIPEGLIGQADGWAHDSQKLRSFHHTSLLHTAIGRV